MKFGRNLAENKKIIGIACLMLALLVFSTTAVLAENTNSTNALNESLIQSKEFSDITISYFYSTGCPACSQMAPFLDSMQEAYGIDLVKYEISSRENQNLFRNALEEHNVPSSSQGYVPTVFLEGTYFIGYSQEITDSIESIILGETSPSESEGVFGGEQITTKVFGIWGVDVSFSDKSLIFSTIVLGVLDSLNVCSITVLVFLLAYILSIGSIKKAFKTGLLFTAVIYVFYFLFVLVLTAAISKLIVNYGFHIRAFVIFISLLTGGLLIKDYFFYGKGFSLKIPNSAKPLLEKYLKQATAISTIMFALLVSLVELPCTAVFPLVYSTILSEHMVFGLSRVLWVALYNLIYVIPLLIIVFGIYFVGKKVKDVDSTIQKFKKYLKLVAGLALLGIALYFLYPLL